MSSAQLRLIKKCSDIGIERDKMDDKPDEKGINQWSRVDQFPEHLKKYVSSAPKFTASDNP